MHMGRGGKVEAMAMSSSTHEAARIKSWEPSSKHHNHPTFIATLMSLGELNSWPSLRVRLYLPHTMH